MTAPLYTISIPPAKDGFVACLVSLLRYRGDQRPPLLLAGLTWMPMRLRVAQGLGALSPDRIGWANAYRRAVRFLGYGGQVFDPTPDASDAPAAFQAFARFHARQGQPVIAHPGDRWCLVGVGEDGESLCRRCPGDPSPSILTLGGSQPLRGIALLDPEPDYDVCKAIRAGVRGLIDEPSHGAGLAWWGGPEAYREWAREIEAWNGAIAPPAGTSIAGPSAYGSHYREERKLAAAFLADLAERIPDDAGILGATAGALLAEAEALSQYLERLGTTTEGLLPPSARVGAVQSLSNAREHYECALQHLRDLPE